MRDVEKFEKKWRNFVSFRNAEVFARCVNCKHFLDCLYYALDQSFDFPKYCPHFEKREKTLKIR